MPEGDTVHVAAAALRRALAGARIERADLRVPRFATADLSGREVLDVVARGKHLLFRVSGDLTLHTHFAMEGSWHLYRHGERWRGPAHEVRAVIETDERVAVGFRLAVVELLETSREHEAVGHLGPDVLGPDWDIDEVLRRLEAKPDMPIADALIDQSIVAGFGNVYRNEICFLRGVWPWTPVGRTPDVRGLLGLGERLIAANRTTAAQVTTGDPRPGEKHWVYGRARRPCRRCGTSIRRRSEPGERVTFWCPACQPEPSTPPR